LDGGEATAEEEELGDADANDRSDELATEEVSRLGEGRFDGVEFKNSTGTLSSISIHHIQQNVAANIQTMQQSWEHSSQQKKEYALTPAQSPTER
jgi:hypothetical protein